MDRALQPESPSTSLAPNPAPVRLHPLTSPAAPSDSGVILNYGSPPTPLTSLIGRDADAAAVLGMLAGGARLLTLTGPGGVGKTRLAVHIAGQAAALFPDGVVFVPLAPIHDPDLVLLSIGQALGLRETGIGSAADLLAGFLHDKRLLLVLDNFEQVRPAASEIASLLAACPGVAMLVTSRARLRVAAEQRFPVAPLALPEPMSSNGVHDAETFAAISASAAVELFVARAQAVDPKFVLDAGNAEAVAAVCRRLDGLPLAIELAAARAHLLTPAELLARLHPALPLLSGGPDDAPDRLRTMRNAIAWSYDLLTAEQQRLFRTLSVFVGGFTLAAAEAVESRTSKVVRWFVLPTSDVRLSTSDPVLDLLAALVDKSLVHREPGPDQSRYAMFETVREFGLEALTAVGDDAAAHDAHADWGLAFAAQAETGLAGPDFAAWVDYVRAELGNVRAAHAWLFARGDAARGLRLAGRLGWFWSSGGYLHEGRELFDRLLAMPGAPRSPADLAHALHAAGDVEQWLGALDRAEERFTRALALFRNLGDARGEIAMLRGLGSVAVDGGNLERAEALLLEVLERSPKAGTPWEAASAANVLGIIAYTRGEYAASLRYCEAAEAGWLSLDDTGHVPSAKINLARASLAVGDPARAAAEVRNVLADLTDAGGDLLVCSTFEVVAALALVAEDTAAAAWLLAVADAEQRLLGNQRWPATQAMFEAMVASARQLLGEPTFQTAWASGAGQPLADAIAGAVQMLDRLDAVLQATGRARPRTMLLTQREEDVLRLLVDGLSDKEIAAALGIGRRTASTHVATIRAKLGAPSRSAAAAIAVRDRLV